MLFAVAHAGKLAEGFQGIPYGDAHVLDVAPLPDCRAGAAPAPRWTCQHTIGVVPVRVSFWVSEGLYTSTVLDVTGKAQCLDLAATFVAAYGAGEAVRSYAADDPLGDRMWWDGMGAARFTYNSVAETCSAWVSNRDVVQLEADRRAERAKAATSGL